MNNDILDRLSSKSKFGQESFNGPKIPTLKLDGSGAGETAGHILRFDNGEMKDLGDKATLQIIRVRKKLWQGGEESKLFSEEYDSSTHDKVSLRRCVKENGVWSKPEIVSQGTPSEIRAVSEGVKVVSVVYAILDGELIKLTVKGASTTGTDGLYDYLDSFKPQHVFQFETDVSVSKVQKNRAISYHRMHFKRGAEITTGFDKVEQYLDLINKTEDKVESTNTVSNTTTDGGPSTPPMTDDF